MRLAKNFELSEFINSRFYNQRYQKMVWDTYYANADDLTPNLKKLAENLQVLRDYIKKPILINIAYRPKWWEVKQGRSGKSKHTFGMAADIKLVGMSTRRVKKTIEHLIDEGKMVEGGIGLYNSFVHYDIRGSKARW